eukprot:EG_transcript_50394
MRGCQLHRPPRWDGSAGAAPSPVGGQFAQLPTEVLLQVCDFVGSSVVSHLSRALWTTLRSSHLRYVPRGPAVSPCVAGLPAQLPRLRTLFLCLDHQRLTPTDLLGLGCLQFG